MKKIPFYELPKLITIGRLQFDGDKTDFCLNVEELFNWGGKTKKEYNAATKEIDAIKANGKGWRLYSWYDVSSYEYWMKQQEEQNYIQITIRFDESYIMEDEIENIVKALDDALAKADAIEYKYSYIPNNN
tara:strand:- start:99 stop:491 length:393 start_codon:yes stop_codon:yes gene_type:complete